MPESDRGFRALARAHPEIITALVERLVPGAIPSGAVVNPEEVDDPHVDLTRRIVADWVARVGDDVVLHVECQGYRDKTFDDRIFEYHLALALRYGARRVQSIAVWLVRTPLDSGTYLIERGNVIVKATAIVLPKIDAVDLLSDPRTACFAPAAARGTLSDAAVCEEVAKVLRQADASDEELVMASIAAAFGRRYNEMVAAMERLGMHKTVAIELVEFGREEGRLEGREEGRLEGRRALLTKQLVKRFGPLGTAHQGLVDQGAEADIDRWAEALLDVGSLDELFAS